MGTLARDEFKKENLQKNSRIKRIKSLLKPSLLLMIYAPLFYHTDVQHVCITIGPKTYYAQRSQNDQVHIKKLAALATRFSKCV